MATQNFIVAAIAGTVLASTVSTATAGISSVSGDIDILTESADFRGNRTESSNVRIYQEQDTFLLPASVSIDMDGAMESGDSLANGVEVNSYYFHFDPVGRDRTVATGSVTFGEQIIGIMVNGQTLFLSDPVLANGSIVPNTGSASRGLDAGGDVISVSADGFTLNIESLTSSASYDQFRVLTAAPIPTPGAMALLGLGGLAAARRRR